MIPPYMQFFNNFPSSKYFDVPESDLISNNINLVKENKIRYYNSDGFYVVDDGGNKILKVFGDIYVEFAKKIDF